MAKTETRTGNEARLGIFVWPQKALSNVDRQRSVFSAITPIGQKSGDETMSREDHFAAATAGNEKPTRVVAHHFTLYWRMREFPLLAYVQYRKSRIVVRELL